jgi:uncharacterized membrane protein YkgB
MTMPLAGSAYSAKYNLTAPALRARSGRLGAAATSIEVAGGYLLRYSLALVIGWIGAMKFTAFEAEAIRPLVASSPFLKWMYSVWGVQTVSNMIGLAELCAAAAIALRPLSAKTAAFGSAIAVAMFLTTSSFLFSLPGWEASLGGFPALSGSGGFLVKDFVLLGAAVWTLGEALSQVAAGRNGAR